MNLGKINYTCMECRKYVMYSIKEATHVIAKYGRIICEICLGKDKNGMLRFGKNTDKV